MKKPQTDEVQTALLAVALAAGMLLVTSCGKTGGATTTSTTAVTVARSEAPARAPARASEVGDAPGPIDDTSQTAALSAPANSNGTTPAKGVSLPPSR